MKLESEPLNQTIQFEHVKQQSFEEDVVRVGNSGLMFYLSNEDPDYYHMHFIPDYEVDSSEIFLKKLKYSTIYCSAFYEFLLWYFDENNFVGTTKPRYITGITNLTMHRFREHLFNQTEVIYETVKRTSDSRQYRIDLEKFHRHPELIEKLGRFHQRAADQNFKMRSTKI